MVGGKTGLFVQMSYERRGLLKAEMLSFGWAVIEIFERKYAVLIRKELEKTRQHPTGTRKLMSGCS